MQLNFSKGVANGLRAVCRTEKNKKILYIIHKTVWMDLTQRRKRRDEFLFIDGTAERQYTE